MEHILDQKLVERWSHDFFKYSNSISGELPSMYRWSAFKYYEYGKINEVPREAYEYSPYIRNKILEEFGIEIPINCVVREFDYSINKYYYKVVSLNEDDYIKLNLYSYWGESDGVS